MDINLKLVRKFGKRSTLFRLFLISFTAFLLLSAIFLISLHIHDVRNQEAINQNYYQSALEALVDSTDSQIVNIHQSITQLARVGSISNAVVKKEYDRDSINMAKLDIAEFADSSLMVRKVIIHFRNTDYVVTSSYSASLLESSAYNAMIVDYLNGHINIFKYADNGGGRISSIFFYDGELYVSRDFPLPNENALATIFFQLNKSHLFSFLQDLSPEGARLFIYDAYGLPLFESQLVYPNSIAEKLTELSQTGQTNAELDGFHMICTASNACGWQFAFVVDDASLSANSFPHFPFLVSLLFISIFLSLLFAAAIALFFYKSASGLLKEMDAEDAENEVKIAQAKNEWALLAEMYREKNEQFDQLTAFVDTLSNDVLIRICLDLFSGSQKTISEVDEILKNTHVPFQTHGLYVVCVLGLDADALTVSSRVSDYIQKLDEICAATKLLSQIIVLDHTTLAVMFSCAENESVLHMKKGVLIFEKNATAFFVKQHVPMRFGVGQIYHSMLDIGFSYNEAMQIVRKGGRLPEAAGSLASSEGQYLPAPAPLMDDYKQRTEWIISMLQQKDPVSANNLVTRMVETIYQSDAAPAVKTLNAKAFLSAFANNIALLEHVSFSSFPKDLFDLDENVADPQEELRSKCTEIIKVLSKSLHRQQMPIILAAKKIIEEQYTDPNLSLSVVAESIGSNMSYLSHQFKVSLGVTFTDYLNKFRVDKSMEALCDTEKNTPVKDIALSVGFCSVQNFMRVFKKYTGKTPGQYRSETRQSDA